MKLIPLDTLVNFCGEAIIRRMQGECQLIGAAQRPDSGLFVYLLRLPDPNPDSDGKYYWAEGPTFPELSPCSHLPGIWAKERKVGEIRHEDLPDTVLVHHDHMDLSLGEPKLLKAAVTEHTAWSCLRRELGMVESCLESCRACCENGTKVVKLELALA